MKITKIVCLGAITLALTACAGLADRQITKSTVPQTSSQVREMVKEIQQKDPVDRQDLSDAKATPNLDADRSKDLFSLHRNTDPTVFKHPGWKVYKVSVNLSNTSMTEYFALLSSMTGINFVLGAEVRGDVNLQLKDVNWTELTEMILSDRKLVSVISPDGKTVRIHSFEFASERSDTTKRLLTQRLEEQRMRDSLAAQSTTVIRVYYSKAETIAKTLRDMIAGVDHRASGATAGATGGRALFTVDNRTNSVIVQASAEDIQWIKKTVEHIDQPSKQVLVEAFIVEGTDDFAQQLGVRLGMQNTNSAGARNITTDGVGGTIATNTGATTNLGTIFNPTTSTIPSGVGGLGVLVSSRDLTNQVRIQLQGMQTDGLSKIISNPRLFIINNEIGTITDGVQIPYPVAGVGANQITYEFKDAALKLEVKPSIVGDGNIYVEVVVNKDSPGGTTSPPPINKREVKTKLLIKDGGIAMIGGINTANISSNDEQTPLLGNIPLIGNLFKATGQGNKRTNLYIFLAPSVI